MGIISELTGIILVIKISSAIPWAPGMRMRESGLLRFPTKQREAFYQSAKEVYREINYTET